MVSAFICSKKSKRCRCMNIICLFVFITICMLCLQTPQKETQTLIKPLEYTIKYDLKLLLENISIQVSNPSNISLKYLVNTKKCKIPNLELFNSDVLPFFERYSYHKCSDKPLLTFVTKENNIATLYIDYKHIVYYGEGIQCCYAYITRSSTSRERDSEFEITTCTTFVGNIVLEEDIVYVSCTKYNSYVVYRNVHVVVTIHDNIHKKLENQTDHKTKPFSILFIGIDSVSRLNFQRSLPKTLDYVQKSGWVEFKAYNKVGLNTYPNLMALLTGRNETTAFSDCKPRYLKGLNNCNFIWNDYRNFDYITAYAEDEAGINTFNYLKKGFFIEPVDYYFRPYFLATEQKLEPFELDGLSYCTGLESAAERVLNVAKDFTTTFNNNFYFGFFWMNSFTHNVFNGPSRMDEKIADFFTKVNKTGVLNNTFVIFLSDHGFRFGGYLQTHSGWVEDRLPFLYMHIPDTFKQTFPIRYNNLLKNANELISPYDIYMTLQEMLAIFDKKYVSKPSSGCPTCKSLFEKIPDRSCSDAGIDSEWCSCNSFFTILQESFVVKEAVKFMLSDIHNVIVNLGSDFEQCAHFTLTKVVSAGVSEDATSSNGSIKYLLVSFEVEPEAVFQGTVSINTSEVWPKFKIEGSVRRINYYGSNSWCTTDATLKQYCYCQGTLTVLLRLVKLVGKQILKIFTGS